MIARLFDERPSWDEGPGLKVIVRRCGPEANVDDLAKKMEALLLLNKPRVSYASEP